MKVLLFALLLVAASANEAHAGLLSGGCSTVALNDDAQIHYASADGYEMPEIGSMYVVAGLSCQSLLKFDDSVSAIKLALVPVTFAMMVPSVNATLAAEVASVTAAIAASPAILAVTTVSAIGVGVTYIVVSSSIDDCRKAEPARLKAELYRELESRYGLKVKNSLPLEFSK